MHAENAKIFWINLFGIIYRPKQIILVPPEFKIIILSNYYIFPICCSNYLDSKSCCSFSLLKGIAKNFLYFMLMPVWARKSDNDCNHNSLMHNKSTTLEADRLKVTKSNNYMGAIDCLINHCSHFGGTNKSNYIKVFLVINTTELISFILFLDMQYLYNS